MSLFITAFGGKLILCLSFTLICFLIAWPVGLYFRYKDAQKMKEVLRDQPINRRNYWLKQFLKLSISIIALYFISFLIALYFKCHFHLLHHLLVYLLYYSCFILNLPLVQLVKQHLILMDGIKHL